mmetsp:Transcript_25454/g.61339  ORF Transcript_25454/g.61339 Transcript_25454/m.61339 type:complete len:112 (+) Transcript_25454:147-482(+)
MEKYDSGLGTIAAAQKARDKGDKEEAHRLFVKGCEELIKISANDPDQKTKDLVKKHVSSFLAEANGGAWLEWWRLASMHDHSHHHSRGGRRTRTRCRSPRRASSSPSSSVG